ncbi:aminoglycoside phosphotransferase family protein [Streptomyces sp. NPDC029003]|uniref:aminoglycoside phosphotransferase family protein n=1 Tax=Streptomyces sp. NPDC029003 TaxID=3155125 RepID=UPI003410F6BC
MTLAAPAGTADWVRHVLATHWGDAWGGAGLSPLTVGGAAPLTHTAGLWRVGAAGGDHVFKVQLNAEGARPEPFHPLKQRILAHCAERGVPVLSVVPAADGRPAVRHDGVLCEMSPLSPGARADGGREQAAAIVATGLDLRAALDGLGDEVADELARVHLPLMVEEEHWPAALEDAERRLLPRAERGAEDPWHRAAARVLRELVSAAPLLRRTELAAGAGRPAVVHGDLHVHHFLLDRRAAPRVLAVLDFDNLHVADRLLDLAWTADTALLACGADTGAARDVLAGLLASGRRRGLLRPGDEVRLMPVLMAHSLPVIVDIAKDILDRGVLTPQWLAYFELLSPARRLAAHRLLAGPPAR